MNPTIQHLTDEIKKLREDEAYHADKLAVIREKISSFQSTIELIEKHEPTNN